MRITEEENIFFHKNLEYFKRICEFRPYLLKPECKETNKPFRLDVGPCYKTWHECQKEDYIPSIHTVEKIIRFFNENITPSISIRDFLGKDLTQTENMYQKKKYQSEDSFLLGKYYCYYYSDEAQEGTVYGGFLKIYRERGKMNVFLFLDIRESSQWNQLEELSDGFEDETPEDRRRKFRSYRSSLNRKDRGIYYCEGEVHFYSDSFVIEAKNVNCSDHVTWLSFNRDKTPDLYQYPGGLGVYLSPCVKDIWNRICVIGISRKKVRLEHLTPQQKECLKLKENSHHRFFIDDEKNEEWLDCLY